MNYNFRRYLGSACGVPTFEPCAIVGRAGDIKRVARFNNDFPSTFGVQIEHVFCVSVRRFFTVPTVEITAPSPMGEFSGQRLASRCQAGQNIFRCVLVALQPLRPGPYLNCLTKGGEYKAVRAETKIEMGSGVSWR